MKRHNQGPASVPNAPMDLTPLLDVIFIFLFIVIINSAIVAFKVEKAQSNRISELKMSNDELDEQVSNLKNQLDAYKDFDEKYTSLLSENHIGERVKIVNISCTNDNETYSINNEESYEDNTRTVRIIAPERVLRESQFDNSNKEVIYDDIHSALEQYIEENLDEDSMDGDSTKIIILSINKDKCFKPDYYAIKEIVDDLRQEYSTVF